MVNGSPVVAFTCKTNCLAEFTLPVEIFLLLAKESHTLEEFRLKVLTEAACTGNDRKKAADLRARATAAASHL
jgi:hypothetical protein